jgi:hypothetical protein
LLEHEGVSVIGTDPVTGQKVENLGSSWDALVLNAEDHSG